MLRAVIVPATPLLVPGAAGVAEVLGDVRSAVREALAELVAGGRVPLVLAHGRATRHGLLRPSLAAAGIGDTWLPDAVLGSPRRSAAEPGVSWGEGAVLGSPRRSAAEPGVSWGEGAVRSPWEHRVAFGGLAPEDVAGVPASVALLALADVLGARAAEVRTLELPSDRTSALPRRADPAEIVTPSDEVTTSAGAGELAAEVTAILRAADGLVVAGGGVPGGLDAGPGTLAPGVAAALASVGAGWAAEVLVLPQTGDHLPPEYRVTLLRD
ncbi:hypothetical protein [Antribacter gilvus]|uniref:hypothetical protein n=1 Tax=Antribacter gilvus TaxID=2304675 RepID=UPI000F767EFC|nr:hypothetical protein [Antribacter gilvus]